MSHYDIGIYATNELQTYCENNHSESTRAQKRCKTSFEGAFNRLSSHSANITVEEYYIPAPFETKTVDNPIVDSFCNFTGVSYSELGVWWKDYNQASCNDFPGHEVALLLSSVEDGSTSGGAMDPSSGHGIAVTGNLISWLPQNYTTHAGESDQDDSIGPGSDLNLYFGIQAISTALHEFGHYAMGGGTTKSHQRGENIERNNKDYMTAMGADSYNYCGKYVGGQDGGEVWWSDCCIQEW